MHFIQNSWFHHNWIFLLLFLIGSVAVVAYINDRKRLLKYSSAIFAILFIFIVSFLLLPEIANSLAVENPLLSSLKSQEKISTFSKIIDFILGILKDKLDK